MATDVFIPSIAARKAARKKTLTDSNSPSSALGGQVLESAIQTKTEPQTTSEVSLSDLDLKSQVMPPSILETDRSQATEPAAAHTPQSPAVATQSSKAEAPRSEQDLSRDMLLKLAGKFGLKLTPEKKEFTKHTYSITPDRKEKMKAMSDSLGINLQDSISEAFDLFFERHQAAYEAILKAKRGL